jgi:hypothetical protein
MATKGTISGGVFQDAEGNPLAGGLLVLTLDSAAVVIGTGQVVNNLPLSITLDVNGNAPTTLVWFNDVLSPAGTAYSVTLFSASGKPAWTSAQLWSFTGGSAINLDTMVPTFTGVSYPSVLLTSDVSLQTVTGPVAFSDITTAAITTAAITTANITNMNGILNATDYPGADIGVQVNAAIAALGTNGGEIYIPAGTYAFANTIYLPTHVVLRGASATGTILNWTPSTGWAIVVGELNNALFNNFDYQGALEDMSLYGAGSATASGAVYLGGSDGALPGSGTVNTSGTGVTSETGTGFSTTWVAGSIIVINGANYIIATVNSGSSITLTAPAGTQTGVTYHFVGSPLVANAPSTNLCAAFNINRVRIVQVSGAGTFGIGFQWGYNSWSQTFTECVIQGTGIAGAYFPPNIGTSHNSGENINFIGSIIGNNYSVGLFVGNGYSVNVNLIGCSIDSNGLTSTLPPWCIQNGTTPTGSGNTVNLTSSYIFSEQQWISNYGYMSIYAAYFSGGSGVSTFLIDNEGQLVVYGGQFENAGSGTYLKSGSAPSLWFAPTSVGGADSGFAGTGTTINAAGLVTRYSSFPTAGNGIPSELAAGLYPNQLGNFNSGTGISLATTTVTSTIRVSFSQSIQRAASSSSTMPSLTLTWTDSAGVSRTKVLVAADSTNLTTAEHDGVAVITSNGTAVTMTSTGYASSGATSMAWTLAYASELL